MRGRGSKREHGGDEKEWRPFSGMGHRLDDDDKISRSPGDGHKTPIGGGGKTPLGDSGQTPSPQRAVQSAGSGMSSDEEHNKRDANLRAASSTDCGGHGRGAEICSDIVDLEMEPDNACESLEHPEWAGMARMPGPTTWEWQQKDHWTLVDLVPDPVRSQVFAPGDLGSHLIPGGQLAAFGNDEGPSSMVSVLQKCALAVLRHTLHILGHVTTDDLPVVADYCLREGLITPIQHKYFIYLDQHGVPTLPITVIHQDTQDIYLDQHGGPTLPITVIDQDTQDTQL